MPASKPDLLAALDWLVASGADEAVGETPVNHFATAAGRNPIVPGTAEFRPSIPARGGPRAPEPGSTNGRPNGISRSTPDHARQALQDSGDRRMGGPRESGDSIGAAQATAAACHSLAELRAAVEAFEGCALKQTATKTVFADGTPRHGIMLIGEAPGRDEDLAGLPFVGRAGKLLDKMLASISLDRTANAYITNVINWRPPGNRDPSPEEAACCLPFLRRHIELAAPEIVVLLGAVACRHVMGRNDGIMRMRGQWLEYHVNGRMIPVMPTLHPAYLLRRAVDKKLAWRDLQEIAEKVRVLGLLEQSAERR